MNPIQSVMITGANAGLGREAARQLAGQKGVEKILLACRNKAKAEAAKAALEAETGRDIFEIVLMDVSKPDSVRAAVATLQTPVDAVILNAGGSGGRTSNQLTDAGVTEIYAMNMLGHVVLVEELLARQLVTSTLLYAGSEAARGIPKMGMPVPDLPNTDIAAFTAIINGSRFAADADPTETYGYIKLLGVLWMGAMARQHPHLRFVTMSPGGTTGTNGFDDMSFVKRLMFKHIGGLLMPLFGMMHSVETGAKRYVDGLFNPKFESGRFYASAKEVPTGQVIDQVKLRPDLADTEAQDNAHKAIQQFA
ncbi:SDR family NAD(P)-dependent oxidoreductase [Thalassobius sp. MITS945101]|uniref:SDR family NAD(P)-dependent oxidoreductase n=1 Tax=Thalassobius sp. MITS945101 TaxID=3096994 RepID=UPI00399AFDD7